MADFGAVHRFAGPGSQMTSLMEIFLAVVPIISTDRGAAADHRPS